jgi:hypothetical protein
MKHHRVKNLRSFGFYALALWNWFPLFVRIAKSRIPSSGKIVRNPCPRIVKNFGKRFDGPADSDDFVSVSNTGSIKGCHHIPLDEPYSLDHQIGLFAGSIPSWDNTSTLELGRTKGIFQNHKLCLSAICSAPITFPPIRLRHCSLPITSQIAILKDLSTRRS